jgi:hypothetical protein
MTAAGQGAGGERWPGLSERAWFGVLLAAAAAALLLRVLVLGLSEGSNDIRTWETFAKSISEGGVLGTYLTMPGFNHPPLAGYYAELAAAVARATGAPFAPVFKIGPFVADLVVAGLLFRFRRPAGRVAATAAAAAYLWSPVAILVTAHHGNTDTVLAALILAAAVLADRGHPVAAGLALGGAVNVKIVALLLVPVLALHFDTWRARLRLGGALAVGAVPFLPVVLYAWPAFSRNAVQYNSNLDHWGVPLFLLVLQPVQHAEAAATAALAWFLPAGRYLILLGVGLVAWRGRSGRRPAVEKGAAAMALMLVLAPGFGVQYAIWVLPVLMAASPRHAWPYGLTAGAFLFIVYLHFWNGGVPILSWFSSRLPLGGALFGVLAWGVQVSYLASTFRSPRGPTPDQASQAKPG